jgi:hypothetical protein
MPSKKPSNKKRKTPAKSPAQKPSRRKPLPKGEFAGPDQFHAPKEKIIHCGRYHLSTGAVLSIAHDDKSWVFTGEREGVVRQIKFSNEAVGIIHAVLNNPQALIPVSVPDES